MIKKIIMRTIIIVLVCVILSKLKLLGILNVSALETYSIFPSSSQIFNGTDLYSTASNLNAYSIFNKDFRGAQTNCTDCWHSNISFLLNYSNYQNLGGNYFSLSTTFFTNAYINGEGYPLKAYIINDFETSMTCSVETSPSMTNLVNNVGPPSTYASYISNITCPNIRVGSGGYLRLFIQGSYRVTGNAIFALSSTTIFDDKDLQNELKEINKQHKETNNLIKDDSSISNDKITDITNIDTNTSNTPVSDFIILPITLLNIYKDKMNTSCSSVNLGTLFGTNLSIPCINIENYLGTNLWNIIDMMFSIFMVYNLAMLCITIWEGITSLHDDFYGAYQPAHGVGGRVQKGEMEGLY